MSQTMFFSVLQTKQDVVRAYLTGLESGIFPMEH